MYIVHLSVSLSTTDVNFNTLDRTWTVDARLVSETRKYSFNRETEKARLPTDSLSRSNSKRSKLVCNCISTWSRVSELVICNGWCTITALSCTRVSALSKSHHRASSWRSSQCLAKFGAACCYCFASCNCCHDPLIVRSAQTRPPFTGHTQLCTSVSMFTISVDNCLFLCSCLLDLQIRRQLRHRLVTVIMWWRGDPWSVEYQSCKLAMLL